MFVVINKKKENGLVHIWCKGIYRAMHPWCYALSAILRRLATAVAHLLYLFNILLRNLYKTLHF